MSPLVLAEDLFWSSRRRRSKMNRKRINRSKLFRLFLQIERWIATYKLNLTAPRKRIEPLRMLIISHSDGICQAGYSDDCAGAALAYLNQREKGLKFEFVEALGCMLIKSKRYLHSNFIAKPIGGSKADNELFFAELAVSYHCQSSEEKKDDKAKGVIRESHSYLTCTRPPVIIPSSETGLYDCESCGRYPGYVKHPKHGLFAEKREITI